MYLFLRTELQGGLYYAYKDLADLSLQDQRILRQQIQDDQKKLEDLSTWWSNLPDAQKIPPKSRRDP